MVQPTGNDWRARVLSEVAGTLKKGARRGTRVSRLSIEIPPGQLIHLLGLAAQRRGTSPTGYIRRAMLAFIAHDLGIPFRTVVGSDPRFSPPGARHPIHDPEGKLGGPWEI
jgi:hypothetical protein